MSDLSEPIPAATLILMRPAEGGPPQILMMERAMTMAFAAGALVFPGGRIDPDDHLSAKLHAPNLIDGAARIAAIRETIEETGITAALDPLPDADTAARIRQAMREGEPFSALLERFGLIPNLGSLTPFARWCPNFREARRFDTFFYLTEAPPGSGPATADSTESVHTFWASAVQTISELEGGNAHAIFPTRRNLERLARFSSIAEAREDAGRHEIARITPWVEERQGRNWVCIPENIGYPVTAEPLENALRR